MPEYWSKATVLSGRADAHFALITAAAGAVACRASFGWALAFAKSLSVLPAWAPTPHIVVVAGEVVAWCVFAILVGRQGENPGHARLSILAFASLCFGAAGVYACSLPFVTSKETLGAVAFLLVGAGRAATLALWVELVGLEDPKFFVLWLSVAYLGDLAAYWTSCQTTPLGCAALSFVSTLAAGVAYVFLLARKTGGKLPPSTNSWVHGSGSVQRTILWCSAFSLAYGLGSACTGLGNSSMEMHVGYALLGCALIALATAAPSRFDLRSVSVVSFVFMSTGLLMIIFLGGFEYVSQVFMSASLASIYALAFTLVCARARAMGESPLCQVCALLATSSLCIQLAKAAAGIALERGFVAPVAVCLLAAIVLGFSLAWRECAYLRDVPLPPNTDGESRAAEKLAAVAESRGLTERETAVFTLLAEGLTVSDISERLFIAPSTVRAHASKVYEKFSVHSRQEFDAQIIGMMAEGLEGQG